MNRAGDRGPCVSDGGARALSAGLQRPEGELEQEGPEVRVNIDVCVLPLPLKGQHAHSHAIN